ncbi:MAG: outer membrane protein assembly factor BamA [Pelagibacteraceae bacterium]|nr:outer membrane protein assembly factor BamA [Pelagibacteraceae bacterium]
MKKILTLVLINILFSGILYANETTELKISGNKRISIEAIKDSIDYDSKKKYSIENLNTIQKKLFETGFFSNVIVKLDSNNIVVNVTENPLIDFFYIEGVINKKREDFIYKNISLGNNKIFSESTLKKDIEFIKDTFRNSGYFDVEVKTEISKLSNNTLNLLIRVERKDKYNIKNIFFIGDKKFSSSKLYDVIISSEVNWWNFLSSNDMINVDRIEFDKSLLKNFYLDNGYYDVQINSSDINFLSPGSAEIIFSINAGNKYNFGKNELVDNEKNLANKNIIEIKEILNEKLIGTYSLKKVKQVQKKINDYLILKKIEFVKFNIVPSKDKKLINLQYVFSAAERNFVNLINIKGNNLTNESVIRRSLVLSEGDAFSNHKKIKSEDKIKNTGIFKSVDTKIVNKGKELVDLDITVEEQPTGSISAGIGIGSAGSAVTSGINEKNLFGKGIGINSNVSLGTEKISGSIDLRIPDFKNTGNTFNFSLFALSTDYENAGYQSKVYGNKISTSYEIYDDLYFNIGGSFDIDKIDANDSASALYKSREGTYNSLRTFYSIDLDKRNSSILPTSGHLINFGQSLTLPAISDIPSLKHNINASGYHQLSENFVLNIKGGLSAINSFNDKDVKLSDRLYLPKSKLRGFEAFGVGPITGDNHIGGNYSAYTSFSSTFPNPLPDRMRATSIMFVDFGNVWGVDFDKSLDADKIRSSIGVSFDWNSPLGPLSFVFAESLMSSSTDKTESFSFRVGSSF